MQTLDYWRCSSCGVILAEKVIVPDRGGLSADCWKCGSTSTLGDRETLASRGIEALSLDRVAASEVLGATYFDPAEDKANLLAGAKSGKRKTVAE